VIFKDQEYTFIDGAKRDLIIHNETDLDDPDDITHAYAIGWVKDATMPIIELWRVSKIKKHRDKYNKQGQKHYSFRDWEMYARKVPLLQVIKYMPCSIEVANAVALSEAADRGRGATIEGGFVVEENTPIADQETGEITQPAQIEHQQPAQTVPQQTRQADTADQWRPDLEEAAAIHAAEIAESQRAAQPAARQRRERGGLGLE
jgi:recombination protein RecT